MARWAICAALVVVGATGAHAKGKKAKKGKSTTLSVVVLPFLGKGTGAYDVKEAIELELELVETVKVEKSDSVEGDMRGKKKPTDAGFLSNMLQSRDVDVLIRGERGPGEKEADRLLVTAYGRDGQPHFFKELALGSEPDVAASTIVTALKPALASWKTQKVQKLPGEKAELKPEDVLADDALEEKPASKTRHAIGGGGGDDDDGTVSAKGASKDGGGAKKTSPVDFNDPADAAPKSKKKRSTIDGDDGAKIAKGGRSEVDENGRRRTIDDIEDEVEEPERNSKLAHTFAISGAFDGATWYYGFAGGGVGDTSVAATFYPGGSVLADAWALPWLGADAELAVAAVPFHITGGEVAVAPEAFTSYQTRAAFAAKARYTLKNGIGLGGRLGYRYFGATVEPQTIDVAGNKQNLTVVPGYQLHGGVVGGEVFLPLLIASHRLEIEVKADALPLTYYVEFPDNPGKNSLAFGWNAELGVRFDVFSGFFFEARGQTTGATITYTEQGSRLALVGNQLQQMQGGSALNLTAGFSTGIGFMF